MSRDVTYFAFVAFCLIYIFFLLYSEVETEPLFHEGLSYQTITAVPSISDVELLVRAKVSEDTSLDDLLGIVRESVLHSQHIGGAVCNIFVSNTEERGCVHRQELQDIFFFIKPILYDRVFMTRVIIASRVFITPRIRDDIKKLDRIVDNQSEWLGEMLVYYRTKRVSSVEQVSMTKKLLIKKYGLSIRVLSFVYRRVRKDPNWLADMLVIFTRSGQ